MKPVLVRGVLMLGCVALLATAGCTRGERRTGDAEREAPSERPMDKVVSEEAIEVTPSADGSTDRGMLSESAPNAKIYFVSPKDGETVGRTFKVQFGIDGMEVVPAGTDKKYSGHFHVLINVDELPDMTMPLPVTDNILHFGGGQTETEITLPPGKHTLQLLLGNYLHVPHSPPVFSEKITVIVE